ncbi:hypothetical protein MPH_03091 [Macrophomina phaseolina MS6]|uniref:Uncharacterized protein n=1 Tax=Macrophomina phaseolina (strain MS6) TaxID=1126212 RepID=K2S3P3_MACPH|nr:hypothetical protein MPH_03091 [Macrophomina phaseolina MS6]
MEDESRSKDPDLRRLVALCNTMDNVAHILTGEYCEDEPADEPADEPEELPEPHDPHWEIPGMDEEEHNQHDPEDEKPHSRVQVQEGKMRPLAAYLIEHVHSPAFGPQDPFIVDDNDDGPVPHVIIRSIEIDGEPEDPDDYPLVCNGGVFGKSGPIDWREEAKEFCLGTKGKQECLMNLDSNSRRSSRAGMHKSST